MEVVLHLLKWATLLLALSPVHATDEAPLVAVYAVRGQTALLPCNLTSGDLEDPVILVLWYKNGTKTPVFSMDSRRTNSLDQKKPRGDTTSEGGAGAGVQRRGGSSRASDVFEGRATLMEEKWSWSLMVRQVGFSDEGEYRCRLDFQSSPTHNARVRLHVVELPKQLRIYSHGGALVNTAAAVQEAHPLTLSCRATGGVPLPNVTWWSGKKLLDSMEEERQDDGIITTFITTTTVASNSNSITTLTPITSYVTNTLHIAAVTRYHLTHNLTCKAANTPVFPPLTDHVFLTQTESRPTVKLRGPSGRLSGGRQYRFTCESMGVRPPPVLTWWLGGQLLSHNVEVRSPSKDSTVSTLSMVVSAADDGAVLECRAAAPTLPHLTSSDSTRLTVHYVPEASISLMRYGREGEKEHLNSADQGTRTVTGRGLRAGDSATLTCTARANPPAYNFTFMFNGRPLNRADVVGGGRSLRLLRLTHRDAGLYTCVASNPEGDGQSNAVSLHIEYAPVCVWEGVREVMAVVGEVVEMECRVRASPPHVSYSWESFSSSFSSSAGQVRVKLRHEDDGLRSIGFLRAENTSLGGGNRGQMAECLPENDVGPADHPCFFSILLIEQPSTLIGCYYHDVTTDSAAVTCSPGAAVGQLPQMYHIEVREAGRMVAAYNNSEPRFNLTSLAPGRDYVLAMFASHARGRGHRTSLIMKTHTPKAEQVAPERVRPANLNKGVEVPPKPTESPRGRTSGGAQVGILVSGVVGVVVGVAVVVTAVVICRTRQVHVSSSSSSSSSKANQYGKKSGDSLLEVPQGGSMLSTTTSPSCEMMTTFASGPVVVTQVTPARRSSTRSLHSRAPSTSGGPVHVVEVEADDITTPTVEIESPSRSRLNLRGSGFTPSDSSTSSVRFDLQQKNDSYSDGRTESHVPPQSTSEVHATKEHPLQQIPTVALTQEMPNIQLPPLVPFTQSGTLPRTTKTHTTILPQTAILHTAMPPSHTITYSSTATHLTSTLNTNPDNILHISSPIPRLRNIPEPQRLTLTPSQQEPLTYALPPAITLSRLASQVHSAPGPHECQAPFDSQLLPLPQETLHTRGSTERQQHSQARPQTPSDSDLLTGTQTLYQHSTLPEHISIKLHSTFR